MVTADLTAAAIYKSGGAITHAKAGQPNWTLAKWLILGSVPFALAGPWLLHRAVGDSGDLDTVLKECIGFALLFAATTYALRLVINLHRVRSGGPEADPDPCIRPLPTLAIGALGGLLVGITSVGSGSVIMISLVILYPVCPPSASSVPPRPGGAAGDRGRRVQHRPQRARLAHPGAARGSARSRARSSAAGSPRGSRSRSSGAAS